ncbi:hypothetical protein [Mycetocola reblochoni]|uniref:hypothetical protein n=1 Tax=Mycetocola reblochoni TaxID=331618 RepID=UPI003F9C64E8
MTQARTLDGRAAGARLASFGAVTPGTCLNVVWQAFGSPASTNGSRYGGYQWATDALAAARDAGALVTDSSIEDAPDGAALFWTNVYGTWTRDGRRVYGDAGHIAIKGRGTNVNTIDLPTRGRAGIVTARQFRAAWSHLKFAGWAAGDGAFLGHRVTTAATASKPSPTIATAGDPNMLYFVKSSADKRVYALGLRYARHIKSMTTLTGLKSVLGGVKTLAPARFNDLLTLLDIPRDKLPKGSGAVWNDRK